MKDKAFARAVNREDIVRGAEQLGMPLDDVITEVIAALKADADRLGLAGTATSNCKPVGVATRLKFFGDNFEHEWRTHQRVWIYLCVRQSSAHLLGELL